MGREAKTTKGPILHRSVQCPQCKHNFIVLREMVGKTRCLQCRASMRIAVNRRTP